MHQIQWNKDHDKQTKQTNTSRSKSIIVEYEATAVLHTQHSVNDYDGI